MRNHSHEDHHGNRRRIEDRISLHLPLFDLPIDYDEEKERDLDTVAHGRRGPLILRQHDPRRLMDNVDPYSYYYKTDKYVDKSLSDIIIPDPDLLFGDSHEPYPEGILLDHFYLQWKNPITKYVNNLRFRDVFWLWKYPSMNAFLETQIRADHEVCQIMGLCNLDWNLELNPSSIIVQNDTNPPMMNPLTHWAINNPNHMVLLSLEIDVNKHNQTCAINIDVLVWEGQMAKIAIIQKEDPYRFQLFSSLSVFVNLMKNHFRLGWIPSSASYPHLKITLTKEDPQNPEYSYQQNTIDVTGVDEFLTILNTDIFFS